MIANSSKAFKNKKIQSDGKFRHNPKKLKVPSTISSISDLNIRIHVFSGIIEHLGQRTLFRFF